METSFQPVSITVENPVGRNICTEHINKLFKPTVVILGRNSNVVASHIHIEPVQTWSS